MEGEKKKRKLRLFYLLDILCKKTDDEHGLTALEICDMLKGYGVNIDRKKLYVDIDLLREMGFDIIMEHQGRGRYYHMGKRIFELPELKLLIDSIQVLGFITERSLWLCIRKMRETVDERITVVTRNVAAVIFYLT